MNGPTRMFHRRFTRFTRFAGIAGTAALSLTLAACAAAPGTAPLAAQRQNAVPALTSLPTPAGTAGAASDATPAAAPATTPARSAIRQPSATPSTDSSTAPGDSAPRADEIAASQLPAVQTEQWKANAPANTRDIVGHDISENECAKVVGAATWTQQGFAGGDGQNEAVQDTFTFTGSAAAQHAYTTFVEAMGTCQATSRADQSTNHVTPDAVVHSTGTAAEAQGWERTWTGVTGISAGGPQTDHTYVAIGGNRLIVLQFTEFPGQAAPYAISGDPAVLTMLEGELAQ